MKAKNYILLLILGLFTINVNAQDCSIVIRDTVHPIKIADYGVMEITVCNLSTTTTLVTNRIKPQISFPQTLTGFTAVTISSPGFNVFSTTGQTIIYINNATIPPTECRKIYIRYQGIVLTDSLKATCTLGFNGPQTTGNDISNDNSTAFITVLPNINPKAETSTIPHTGGLAANVLSNDSTNGVPSTIANSVISGIPVPSGFIFNTSNGNVSVNSGTAAGTYYLTYQLCDTRLPQTCATITDSFIVLGIPLSINFINKYIVTQNCNPIYYWQVSENDIIKEFEILGSTDAINFYLVEKISASKANNTYSCKLPSTHNVSYFKIKTIETNGNTSESSIDLLKINCNQPSVSIYPIPAVDVLEININNISQPQVTTITIKDVTGRLIKHFDTNLEAYKTNLIKINISELAAGNYYLDVPLLDTKNTLKFIKK